MNPGYPAQIEITILNRKFPVKVKSLEEETSLRESAIWLEQALQHYKKQFFVRDEVYLVLMCFLEFATERNQLQKENEELTINSLQDWNTIEKLLDSALPAGIS